MNKKMICNATGNGICTHCPRVPPKINGYSCGDICRKDVDEIISALVNGNIVCYNSDNDTFYEKIMYTHPTVWIDDDWEAIV